MLQEACVGLQVAIRSEGLCGHFSPISGKRDPHSSPSSTTDQLWGFERISPILEPQFPHNEVGLNESKATDVLSQLKPAHES